MSSLNAAENLWHCYNCGVRSLLTRRLTTVLALLISAACFNSCSKRSPSAFAITHVTVINVTGAAPQRDSTVIVSGGQIIAVGAADTIAIPRDAKVMDARGKFLIPGLADMHLHLTGAGEPTGSREFILPLLIANGITTVRDMGGRVEYLKGLRSEIESAQRLGPQIFFTGPYLDGDPPAFQPSVVIRNKAEAAATVEQLKSAGVDFIKTQSHLGREGYFAIAEECRAQNIRFVGHVPDTVSAAEASAAGQTSIEHLTGVLVATSTREQELRREQLASGPPNESVSAAIQRSRGWQRKLLESLSTQKAARLLQEFARNHTWQVPTFPTLVHMGFLTPQMDLRGDPWEKYVPSKVQQIWEQGRKTQMENRNDVDFALRAEIIKRSLEIVGKMNEAGVPIMAGTDAAAPNVFPGFSLHEDLFYLVKAGLKPMQALQAATVKPAQFLERNGEQGSVAAGKRADLVLLDANPLEDIRNTQRIRAVVVNGRLLERRDLDELLTGVERYAKAH